MLAIRYRPAGDAVSALTDVAWWEPFACLLVLAAVALPSVVRAERSRRSPHADFLDSIEADTARRN